MTVVLAACLISFGASVSMGAQTPAPGGSAGNQDPPALTSLTIEFDLPPDFSARAPDGTFVWRMVQAGYFDARPLLIRTVQIPREAVRVSGRTAAVTIPLFPLPASANRVNVRLRALSSGSEGAWSAPVGPVTMPGIERPRRRDTRPRVVTSAEVAARPALKEAIGSLASADLPVEEILSSFRSVRDLASAVVLSREHGLSFPAVCRAIREPDRSLANVVEALKPSLDVARALRDAQPAAQALLARPRRVRP